MPPGVKREVFERVEVMDLRMGEKGEKFGEDFGIRGRCQDGTNTLRWRMVGEEYKYLKMVYPLLVQVVTARVLIAF
jgi:hypothetical protein